MMPFFDVLVRYETALWNQLDRHLRDSGAVSLALLTVLQVVHSRAGACRVQEIRSDLGITVGAASKIVDRLERDGLVRRSAHPHDGRSSLVDLTAAGDAARADGERLLGAALAEHLGGEDVSQATALMGRLLRRLTDATAGAAR